MTTTIHQTSPAAVTPVAARADTGIRLAAAAGIAFVVLSVGSTVSAGSPPAADSSAAKIASYFHAHSGGIRAQLLLGGLGIAALLWWFSAVWRLLSRAEREQPRLAIVAALALGLGVALAMLNGVAVATAALRPGDPETTRVLYTLSIVAIAAAGFGLGTSLLATSAVTYRARTVPAWISGLGFVAALAFYASTIGSRTGRVRRLVRVDRGDERDVVALGGQHGRGAVSMPRRAVKSWAICWP
jgi:hypothetical protein